MATVIVVTGQESLRIAIVEALKKTGHDVTGAATGSEGLELLRDQRPDVLLLDMVLPDMAAPGFLTAIKGTPAMGRPIVVLGTEQHGEHVDELWQLGAREIWLKSDSSLKQLTTRVGELASQIGVLIVEDHPDVLGGLQRVLQSLQFRVSVATTLHAALRALEQVRPSHVLLDLMLPDGSGVGVLERIRSLNLPARVAVLTGAAEHDLLESANRLRPDVLFIKPVPTGELVRWLRSTPPVA